LSKAADDISLWSVFMRRFFHTLSQCFYSKCLIQFCHSLSLASCSVLFLFVFSQFFC
jgi:hypothetical protein